MSDIAPILSTLLNTHEPEILAEWLGLLQASGALSTGRIVRSELETQCRALLSHLRQAVEADPALNVTATAFEPVRAMLGEVSRSRAVQGFSPAEIATFVFSLKQPVVNALTRTGADGARNTAAVWQTMLMLDDLGLFTIETYQKTREEIISRQSQEIAELSTPVVKLWDSILALPLIGTLDSQRTQVVMENMLQAIVDEGAEIAIIDITGVPTVDTLTAQHLLKTVAAARLMGADCIISGIRPQIAQTMVHLGVELNVVSKATLADAFALALRRLNRTVVTVKARPAAELMA
jgi:rsbT co-antagonist protein RsbR